MREGWEYKKLGDVCDKGSSNIVINKLGDNNGEYPLYGASGLVKSVNFYHQDKPYIGIVKDGAGVGRVNIYPAFSSLVGTMQYIFTKDDCLLNYLKYFLIKLDLSHCVSGATIPHIYFKDYSKKRIPVPSLETQQSIVSELDKINELISLKKSQLEDLDSLAQSIFYDMFGDPIENEKGWEVKKLGEIGYCCSGGTPSRKIPEYFSGNKNWFSAGELNNLYIDNSIEKITQEALESSAAKLCPAKSLFIGMYDTAAFKMSIPKISSCSNQACANINPYKDNVIYLYFVLQAMKEEALKSRHGVRQKNLNLSYIKAFKIPLPPLSLQQTFAKRIEVIEQQKQQINKTIKDLETLLASRMQYWFD